MKLKMLKKFPRKSGVYLYKADKDDAFELVGVSYCDRTFWVSDYDGFRCSEPLEDDNGLWFGPIK